MTTNEQIAANKANAKKSTGPKTAEGKVISKMNAVTYGFLAECALMSTEDADEFEALRAMLLKVFKPHGKYEFKRHRFPAVIIRHSIWLYARLTLSFRDVEEMLARKRLGRHSTRPCAVGSFGSTIAANLRRTRPRSSDH